MWRKYFVIVIVISAAAWSAEGRQSRAERKLVELKASLMSADYRGDLAELAALRTRAAEISNDSRFGYLADYWSGFASWRIALNGVSAKMSADEAKGHLGRAVTDFESSLRKKSDFADAFASAAAVHGWLAAYSMPDQTKMNQQIGAYKQLLNRALELEPNNPRALWIQAVPFLVLPPERGGNIDRAIELYRKMLDNSRPLEPASPLPDWGKAEAWMSLANAHVVKTSPDVDAAAVEAKEALRLQPEWRYVQDVLMPQIEARRKQLAGKE
jgi:tetratricopeptide (TPR) repeat protein